MKKVIEINNCLLGTMAGGAAVRLHQGCPKDTGFLFERQLGWVDAKVLMYLRLGIGLSILVGIPRDAMPSPRATT